MLKSVTLKLNTINSTVGQCVSHLFRYIGFCCLVIYGYLVSKIVGIFTMAYGYVCSLIVGLCW